MPAVIYPAQIKKDKDKLFACYSLIEQLRLEYNRVSAIGASDKGKYIDSGKFRAYADKCKDYLKQALAERNSLIENIRWVNYTPEEWKAVSKLSIEEQGTIYKTLFGDRQVEQVKPTLATSPLLDDLKATSLDDMPSKLGNDPTEDFTTYTEVDEGSDVTKTADRITVTAAETTSDTFIVYKDAGVNHFNGNFDHLGKHLLSAIDASSFVGTWMVSNDIGDRRDFVFSKDYLVYFLARMTNDYRLYLEEDDGANLYQDYFTGFSLSTVYYVEIERDEAVGTYGTLYAYICTGNYWDLGGTQVDTLSIALHTSKKDFRYIYGLASDDYGTTGRTATGYVELLDLQEPTGQPTMRRWGGSILPMGAQRIGKGW